MVFMGKKGMMNVTEDLKTTFSDELYAQYSWFYNAFLPKVQECSDDFFLNVFNFQMASLSLNINALFQGSSYFVTKIRIDKQHDVFIRTSEEAVGIIFDRILGRSERKIDLNKITDLEAKIITSFNDYIFNHISPCLLDPPPITEKRKNFDIVHLTFFIKDIESEESAKFILSLPKVLLEPQVVVSQEEKFSITDFKKSLVDVKIKVGTTKFPVKDLKCLEKEDIVVFDNSNLQIMRLYYDNYEKDFRITPNPGLIMSVDNDDGGDTMEDNALGANLWDSIQVEMGAEFDKVKISLGELKNIEEGLVVDVSSVYNSKVSLKVENKTIAKGELVIINDRYGVKIDEVYASGAAPEEVNQTQNVEYPQGIQSETIVEEEEFSSTEDDSEDEEFDYSDFELDDDDI